MSWWKSLPSRARKNCRTGADNPNRRGQDRQSGADDQPWRPVNQGELAAQTGRDLDNGKQIAIRLNAEFVIFDLRFVPAKEGPRKSQQRGRGTLRNVDFRRDPVSGFVNRGDCRGRELLVRFRVDRGD